MRFEAIAPNGRIALWAIVFCSFGASMASAAEPAAAPPSRQGANGLPAVDPARNAMLAECTRLGKDALLLRSQGKLAEAIAAGEKMLGIQRGLYAGPAEDLAVTLNWIGQMELDRENFAPAEKRFQQALDTRAALIASRNWKLIDARTQLERAKLMATLTADQRRDLRAADRANSETLRLLREGKFPAAFEQAKTCQSIRQRILGVSHPDYAQSLNNLAAVYSKMGDYGRAQSQYLEALKIIKAALGEIHPSYAALLTNLAWMYRNMGDYARAEPLCRQASEIQKQVVGESHFEFALSLNNLADLYASMGDYARAEPLCRQALEIQKRTLGEASTDYAQSMNNLGALYYNLGDYARAEALYRQALDVYKQALGATHPDYALCLNNLGMIYRGMGDYARAEPLCRQATEIWSRTPGKTHPSYALGLNNLALLASDLGDYSRAEKLGGQALEIRRQTLGEMNPDYAETLNNMALLDLNLGRTSAAAGLARQAVQIQRRSLDLTALVQSERQQLAMGRQVRGYLDNYLAAALAAGLSADEIYAEAAAWKGSIAAQQQLVRARQRALAADPASELAKLFAKLGSQSRRLAALGSYTPKPEEATAIQQTIRELSESIENSQQRLSQLDPDFHRIWAEREISPQRLRESLPRGSALVDLLEYDQVVPLAEQEKTKIWQRRLVAFVLRPQRPVACVQLGPSSPIGPLVDAWRSGYGSRPTKGGKLPGDELRRLLWEPLEAELQGVETVLVSPDGAVARLPWGALPGKKPGTFLIEERAIAVVPVPQRLSEMLAASSSANTESLLLLGNVDFGATPGASASGQSRAAAMRGKAIAWPPLANTKIEIDEVKKIFVERFGSAPADVLQADRATEGKFRREAGTHRYLHVATHGFFSPPETATAPGRDSLSQLQPSLLSGIVLAGANAPLDPLRDDGILTAFEVSELNLERVELVTLSACETGLGQTAGGEGVLGLQRAFQVAGARTVVSGLWKVPDRATQMLMVRFYQNLWQKKLPKLAALREAQIWMLRSVPQDPRLLADASRGFSLDPAPVASAASGLGPRFWAAFVLSGDWR